MDEIDKSIIEGTNELRETLTGISKAMEKIEIVNKIISKISTNLNHSKECGIIVFENEFRILRFYIALKELWSTEKGGDHKLLAEIFSNKGELVLLKSAPEIELLVILNELECKTFKMVVE